jgi:glutathione peroxidase
MRYVITLNIPCIYIINLISQILGLTNTNYMELISLYDKYSDKGLEILAFPCNSFYQETGDANAICDFAKSKGVTFPLMAKVDCAARNNTHPLFSFLCQRLADTGAFGYLGHGVKWNFTKFLCDGNGVPVKRYAPRVNPLAFENDIVELLNKNKKVIYVHSARSRIQYNIIQ